MEAGTSQIFRHNHPTRYLKYLPIISFQEIIVARGRWKTLALHELGGSRSPMQKCKKQDSYKEIRYLLQDNYSFC